MIKIEKINEGCYKVYYHNGVLLGDFIYSEDGYLHFWPDKTRTGAWSSHVLKEIAEKLDELNKWWDDQVQESHLMG